MSSPMSRRAVLGGTVAASLALAAPPAQAASRELLIFVALDGFDIDYFDGRVPLPNLRSLIRRGSLSTSTGVMTSITNPSWTAISCGTFPDRTKNGAYYYDEAARIVRGQSRDSAVEGLGQAWRRQGVLMGSAQWFILQDKGVAYGDAGGVYTQPGGRIDARVDDAIALLEGRPVNSGGKQVQLPRRPDFLAIYSSDVDGDGHQWGPNDPRMLTTLAETDRELGRLIEATKRLGLAGRTTWVVTADHGMSEWRLPMAGKALAALSAVGFTPERLSSGTVTSSATDIVLVNGGGTASVHLLGPLAHDQQAVQRAATALAGVEGVLAVHDKVAQAKLRMAPQFGQLVIELDELYALAVAPPAEGSDGWHGSRGDLAVPLILSGFGVRTGVSPREPRHVDLAPTMSAILGVDPPSSAEGRVLTEVLR